VESCISCSVLIAFSRCKPKPTPTIDIAINSFALWRYSPVIFKLTKESLAVARQDALTRSAGARHRCSGLVGSFLN